MPLWAFSPPDSWTAMPLVPAHIAHFICSDWSLSVFISVSVLTLSLDGMQKRRIVALLSVLSLGRWDFDYSWQQGLAREASLADEGRVPQLRRLLYSLIKGRQRLFVTYRVLLETAVMPQSVICQSQVDPCQVMQTMVGSSVSVPLSSGIQCGCTSICPQSTLGIHWVPSSYLPSSLILEEDMVACFWDTRGDHGPPSFLY